MLWIMARRCWVGAEDDGGLFRMSFSGTQSCAAALRALGLVSPFVEHGGANLQLVADFGDGFTKVEQAYSLICEFLGLALIGFLVHGF